MVLLETAAIYVGANLLILLVLQYLVVRLRRKHKIALGIEGPSGFNRAIRAHANAAENIPAALVGLVVLALLEPATPAWLLHASGISLTLGRLLHGIGLHTGTLNAGRVLGVILTWVAYALIGGSLIYLGLSRPL